MSTAALDALLACDRLVISDGGFATELERHGIDINTHLWSAAVILEQPKSVSIVHRSFLDAGSDIIETASYQISKAGFQHAGMDNWVEALQTAIQIAVCTRAQFVADRAHPADTPIVAASLGPLGAAFHDGSEFNGAYGLASDSPVVPLTSELKPGRQSLETLMEFHRERLQILAACEIKPDILAFETIPCGLEGRAIATLLSEFPTMKAWLSFSCGADGKLVSGEPIEAVISAIESLQHGNIVAYGVNCCSPLVVSDAVIAIRRALGSGSTRKLIVYPNSGEVWNATTGGWDCGHADVSLLSFAEEWRRLGVWAIGGCCRTTPEMVAALKKIAVESG